MQIREILAIKGTVLYTVAPDKTLAEAVATMSDNDIGSLICFAAGKMVGMLSFREVLNAVHAAGAAWGNVKIGDVMVTDPLTVTPQMPVEELRRLMIDHHVRYLPVMDGGTLMGIVSFHDVAKAVLEAQSFENRMLKAYIKDWPEQQKSP
jgi:CBS domain-containing protein